MSDNCTCGCGNDHDQNLMTVPELFGSNVFNNKTMKERLPKETYKALQKTIDEKYKRLEVVTKKHDLASLLGISKN